MVGVENQSFTRGGARGAWGEGGEWGAGGEGQLSRSGGRRTHVRYVSRVGGSSVGNAGISI